MDEVNWTRVNWCLAAKFIFMIFNYEYRGCKLFQVILQPT